MVIGIDAIVCIVGLLMYVLAANPKLQELGRNMFWVGLLAFLLNGDKFVALVTGRNA